MREKEFEALKEALWSDVRHVLLDMDGTLLDRYFDDYFWGAHVPEKYAEKYNMAVETAKERLYKRFKKMESTLSWSNLDYWTEELGLDIPALKEEITELIKVHPYVEAFLQKLEEKNKITVLTTNAHFKTIAIKMREAKIGRYFDRIITSFDMGHPKEDREFWERMEKVTGFEKEKTLFIDDTEKVIDSAKKFGIKYLLLKRKASSREEERKESPHLSIDYFSEIL